MISGPTWFASLPAALRKAFAAIRGAFVGVVAASTLVNVLMLVGPMFMLQVYDRVLPSRSGSTLVGLLMIALVLLVIQAAVDVLRSRLLVRMGEVFDLALRGSVFNAVQHAALNRTGFDGLQIMRDLDTTRGFLSGSGLVALCDLPWTPLYILVIALFHPLLGLAVAVGAVGLCLITLATEMFTRRPTVALVALASTRRMVAETSYDHAETVHALGMHRRMGDIWSEHSSAYLGGQRRTLDLSSGFGGASRLLRMTLQCGVLAIGAYLVVNREATAGVMLAAAILSIRALAPIELAIANWRGFIACRDSVARLREALAALPMSASLTPLPAPRRELRVTTISLNAPRSQRLVLHDVGFALQAGSALAILGPSGSGKSTLVRALVGVLPPVRGVIRIDGAALGQWDMDVLGGSIGFLPQDVALFRGTVAQNISRFSAVPDANKILAAAAAANVHNLILALPHGYETEVGDGGLMLSGGQRQRIALARALYNDPFLVVLDEPDSNLDSEGERALVRAIAGVRARGGIVILVAHRPHLLNAVDHLMVLNGGRVRAFGKSAEVLPLLTGRAAVAQASPSKPAHGGPNGTKAPSPRARHKGERGVAVNE